MRVSSESCPMLPACAVAAAQVVATDINMDNLASLTNEAPDIRTEVMDVKKYEDVEVVIPGVRCGLKN